MRNGCRWGVKLADACIVLPLLIWSFIPGSKASNSTPHLEIPDYTIYHSKSEIFREVEEIVQRNPSSFKIEELTAGDAEYSSTLKVVTVEPSGLSTDYSHKIRLLLDFGEHGRELVTVEVALRLLQLLSDPSAAAQNTVARGGDAQKLLALLERCVFKVIPMENVHGRDKVENGTLCERKNGRGVDSNRNWSVHWGFREKDYDPSEEYPGTEAFSEPEAQMLERLANDFQPHVWMNMHSGMEALFMPYDHLAALPDDRAGRVSLSLLSALNKLKCGGRCATGSGGKSVGYLAHGTATDYMHDILGVPFSFTWEIYGDLAASFQDCFRMFNPLTKDHLEEVVRNWADAVLAMVELLPSQHTLSRASGSLLPRKILPAQDFRQQFNHTSTDAAAEVRAARLEEILAAVVEVEQAVGQVPEERWDLLLGVPGMAWIALLCFALLILGLLTRKQLLAECAARGKSRTWRKRHAAVFRNP